MQVGDFVQVTNTGKLYSTYEKYFALLCPEYLEGYRLAMQEYNLKKGDYARVLFVHDHTMRQGLELSVIEPENHPDRYYLIGSAGLEYALEDCEIDVSSDELMSLLG